MNKLMKLALLACLGMSSVAIANEPKKIRRIVILAGKILHCVNLLAENPNLKTLKNILIA